MQGKSESLADVARRSFADHQLVAVFAALDRYTGPEPERVQRAILTLSDGDVGKLSHNVAVALQDYPDVLYWAEYPPSA
jgi:hypothetical protein